jgi:hypothetical protein
VARAGRRRDEVEEVLEVDGEVAARHGVVCPVVPVDVRDRAQVLSLVDLLLVQLESRGG